MGYFKSPHPSPRPIGWGEGGRIEKPQRHKRGNAPLLLWGGAGDGGLGTTHPIWTGELYHDFTFCLPTVRKRPDAPDIGRVWLCAPLLDLFVIFGAGDLADGSGELHGPSGALDLAAELPGEHEQLRCA